MTAQPALPLADDTATNGGVRAVVRTTGEACGPPRARRRGWRSGARELGLVLVLYAAYTVIRAAADGSFAGAAASARHIATLESGWGLHVEAWFSSLVSRTPWLAVPMSYWYETLHFLVTGGLLVWLFVRRSGDYARMRNALLLATVVALALYLLLPTAPPRLLGAPYHDVLARSASIGWWGQGESASVAGGVTNPYAAFPSMHAGWALWVALVLRRHGPSRAAHLGVAYALVTAVVVIGTGNHWVTDVLAGWLVVGASFALALSLGNRRNPLRVVRSAP